MTEDDLLAAARGFVAKWRPRLHLTDWRIFVEIGEVPENEGAHLSTDWRERASVLILPPDHAKRQRDACRWHKHQTDAQMLEETVVHELLHACEFPAGGAFEQEFEAWMGDGTATSTCRDLWRNYRECWINHVTRVLIEADRGAWTKEVPHANGSGALPGHDHADWQESTASLHPVGKSE